MSGNPPKISQSLGRLSNITEEESSSNGTKNMKHKPSKSNWITDESEQ